MVRWTADDSAGGKRSTAVAKKPRGKGNGEVSDGCAMWRWLRSVDHGSAAAVAEGTLKGPGPRL